MHFLESSGNKLLSISRLISTSNTTITQTNSSLMNSNNINIGGSNKKNTVVINFTVKNEKIEESNKNVKISLEVQSNMTITTLVFY